MTSRESIAVEAAIVAGDRSRRPARWAATALIGLLVALQLSQAIRVASQPAVQIVSWNVIIDDGFYYLQVAHNLARGHGSTFDRVNRTNGYQPLWAFLLVPIFWFTDDPATGMQAALILAGVLESLALLLLYLTLQRLVGLGSALLACALVVANPYYLQILQGGLETPVLMLCLTAVAALFAFRGERILAGRRRDGLLLGSLLGLTVLARTDVALVLVPLALVLLVWGPGSARDRLRRALWVGAPAAALILPFVLWSLATQGTPLPISGLVKRWVAATYTPTTALWRDTEQWRGLTRTIYHLLWPYPLHEPELTPERILPLLRVPAALLLLLSLRWTWSRRARQNRLASLLLASATLGAVGHGLFLFFIYRSTGHWNYHYFFPFALVCTVIFAVSGPLLVADLGLLLDHLLRRRLRIVFAALGLLLCLPFAVLLIKKGLPEFQKRMEELRRPAQASFRKCRWDAAEHLRRTYPPEEVFGSWWAGTLGYLSDRRVVNLDGVINSASFFRRYLQTDTVPRYIVESRMGHLIDFFWRDPLDPRGQPAPRVFWWEHDKEHIVRRLLPRLRLARVIPFSGPAGMYLMEVKR